MAAKFKIEGLKELEKNLMGLKRATAKNVARKVLKEAGEPVAAAARRNTPIEEGHLRESIDVGTKLTRRQAALHRKMAPEAVEVFVGPNDPAGVQQEFGNERHSAQPFMRPAWDGTKDEALKIITHRLGVEIDKAAERAARKAAKKG